MNPFADIGRALEFRPGDALASGAVRNHTVRGIKGGLAKRSGKYRPVTNPWSLSAGQCAVLDEMTRSFTLKEVGHEAAFRRFCAKGVGAHHGGVSFPEILGRA